MSLGKVLVPANAVWLAQLREQFRSIALHLDRRRDDVADACLYGLEVVSRWQRGGQQCEKEASRNADAIEILH